MNRTEILFAPWAVKSLREARGARWKRLVDQIAVLPEDAPDSLAFQLLMIRINSCVTCDARRYMERGGCGNCAATNLSFSRETEAGLIDRYKATRKEIAGSIKAKRIAA